MRAPSSDSNTLPIALRKGKHTCTAHPLSHFVFYADLSPSFRTFISYVSTSIVPKSVSEVVIVPH